MYFVKAEALPSVDFDGGVNDVQVARQELFEVLRRMIACCCDPEFAGEQTGSDGPDMQVSNFGLWLGFNGRDNRVHDILGGLPVEQDFAGVTEQSDGPTADEN